MSYAVRNTIILLVTLFLLGGAAFGYLKFVQESEIEELDASAQEKRTDLRQKQQISASYPDLKATYDRATEILTNYDKTLFESSNPDDAFDYLNALSTGESQVFFDFAFEDSTSQDQFGVIQSTITGYGNYQNLFRFIYKIENGRMINKITELSVNPATGDNAVSGEVNFSMNVESYYQSLELFESQPIMASGSFDVPSSIYNPFTPLITAELPENEDGLIDVELSRMIGLTTNRVFLVDQNGSIQTVNIGDRVFLGSLSRIDLDNRTATFRLNKGGIIELITLEIER